MKTIRLLSFSLLAVLLWQACGSLEKEIDLELPEYQSQYVVECYLEPGQPFTLLLTRSFPYFKPFPSELYDFVESTLINTATVRIHYAGKTFELENGLYINPQTKKLYNYAAPELVPADYENPFELDIITPEGRHITATTRILPVVPIDSIVVEFSESADSLARVLTYLTDPPGTDDYYRRMLHKGSLDSIPEQDFTTFDDFVDDGKLVFGTGFDFMEGDTVISTIFHIDRAYFDFWESVQNAINANGNPFSQPSAIISNLQGDANAIGIFTGLSYDRKIVRIRK